MTYPIIMIIVGAIVLLVITNFVIPQITQIFTDANKAMPLPTQIMIGVSGFFQANIWYIVFGVLGMLMMLERFIKTEAGRVKKDKFLLNLPLLGVIFSDLCVTRFARTLGTLLKSGVPMIGSLEVARNVVNNALFEEAISAASVLVTEGKSLNLALKQSQLFPPIIIHMVSVGEKTGDLENMLLNVAENYDQQIEARLGKMTGLLEPLMIVAMVLVVGFIVMAVLMPIFEMQNV
jgi:general secretion pathway protein F